MTHSLRFDSVLRGHRASAPAFASRASRLAGSALLLAGALLSATSTAQTPDQRPRPLPALGRNVVSNSDTTAMVQNPANLAFLPGPELRWSGYFLGDEARVPSSGHAFAFGFPLGFIPVSTGLRYDLITPTRVASNEIFGGEANYQWLTWAIATGSDTASLGFSFSRSYSDQPQVSDFGTWSVGLNLRPSDYFGLAGVVRQVDSPNSDSGAELGTEYVMGGALRPFGTDIFELGIEGNYIDEQGGYWMPRATADVGIPHLGRLRGGFAWQDPASNTLESSWVASTSLVVHANTRSGSGELSVGSRYGDGLGAGAEDRPYENIHAEVALRGFRASRAAQSVPYAVRVRLEDTPDVRGHTALLRRLWAMAEEPRLAAVLLELRASPAGSLAHVQELQDAIMHLQNNGKKVLCHIETGSGAALYLCSVANKFLINPAGNLRFAGLSSQSFYVRDLLDKLGIRADFVRIGKYKSAPEMYVRREGSDPAIQKRAELMQGVEIEMAHIISKGRNISVDQYRELVRKGPFTAAEAKTGGLVDGFAFDDMLEEKVDDMAGESLIFESDTKSPEQRKRFGPQKRLAIIYVDGNMVDGRSQVFPIVGTRTVGSYTIADSLKQVREDPSIGAVVLRVETGGGSAMAADVIWREVQLTAAKKPLVVSMGTAAASGGYYISAPGSYIYANPLTITGSIGIFYGKMDVAGLLRMIGVNVQTLTTTSQADAESPFRPFTEEEREILKDKIEQAYGLFLQRVADGRGMKREEVDEVGRGQVWLGRAAKERGLVDGLGGLRQALAKARTMGGVADDAPIVELPVPQTSLVGKLLGVEGLKNELKQSAPPLPPQMMEMVRALVPYALYDAHTPMARIEVLPQLIE